MKVLMATPGFPPDIGGIETLLASLIPELRMRGHQIVVGAGINDPPAPRLAEYDGTPVHRLPFQEAAESGRVHQTIRDWRALCDAVSPDLVHLHASGPVVFFHHASGVADRIPTLFSLHQDLESFGYTARKGFLSGMVEKAAAVTAVSEGAAASLAALFPQIEREIHVVPNGIVMPREVASPPAGPPTVLVLGRLVPQKRVDLAVEAFACVLDRHPETRLVIAGIGPERSALERQVAALGLGGEVDFLGAVDRARVPALYGAATVVLMPSASEGLPLVAIESGAHGRAVVGTRVSGIDEIVVHSKTGLLAPPGDAEQLGEMVSSLLSDPTRRQRLADAARSRVLERFSLRACADRYDALYRACLAPAEARA